MASARLTLANDMVRERAINWCRKLPIGTRVVFSEPKRSDEQSDRMWAMLGELASQLTWHGLKLTKEDWKLIMLDALHREMRIVPNIDGTGFVNLNTSTRALSKSEMSDLMALIEAFGAKHGVAFHEPERRAA